MVEQNKSRSKNIIRELNVSVIQAFQTMESKARVIENIGEDAVFWRRTRYQLSYLIFPTFSLLRSRDCFPVSEIMLAIEFISTCLEDWSTTER